ncbi:MAG: hypothetical protein GF341_11585 [candidate division Zixibacteria bacterium]|nr:hypothetical protein [candidate division Zixibacteria bacterium]
MFYRSCLLTVIVLIMLAGSAHTAVPTSITVQGRLTDGTGTPLPAGLKELSFRIYNSQIGGAQIWPPSGSETQVITSDAGGLWTANVGSGAPLTTTVFADSVRWLEITVSDGINPIETLPRVRLLTGPYAHRVTTLDGSAGGTITSKVSIGPNNTNSGDAAFVAGADNTVSGEYAVVGGGRRNYALGDYSTIAGGGGPFEWDSNYVGGTYATIGGGHTNEATGEASVVAGGSNNTATSKDCVIGGGSSNLASAEDVVIGGGSSNVASADEATVAGGRNNEAIGTSAVVGGGRGNVASEFGTTVAGGLSCLATANSATVGGGFQNEATSGGATIAGGWENIGSGNYASIPGGYGNTASGDYSFAGGHNAHAAHDGAFVWNGHSDVILKSTADDQVLWPAEGGVGIGTDSPLGALHVKAGPNGNGLYIAAGVQDIAWPNGQNFQLGQWDGATFTERARFTGGGFLGVNTTSVSSAITLPNIANVNGRGLANRWDTYSSRRWKIDIQQIEKPLDLVQQLSGVRYKHKSDSTPDIGLIAEDVGQVIPEIVQYEDNGIDARSVDYARLVALLIEGMKEQQRQIEALRTELSDLRTSGAIGRR